ncbi:MAG: holin family protein [Pseudomonadota bacterium]
MGLMGRLFDLVFGGNLSGASQAIERSAGAFWENPEARAARDALLRGRTLQSYNAEFLRSNRRGFDVLMDGINRLPRPMLALGTIGLFASAMWDPLWFASRMQGLALVPEPLWWLMGAIVSFYFGARHQMKAQEFQRSLTQTMAQVPKVVERISAIERLRTADTDGDAQLALTSLNPGPNAALEDWKEQSAG